MLNRDGSKIADSKGLAEGFYKLAWNADGSRLAVVTLEHIYLFDSNGNQIRKFPDFFRRAIAWSPEGTILAAASDFEVYLYDNNGNFTGITLRGRSKIGGLAWSPDGSILATGGERGDLLFWNREGLQIGASRDVGPISPALKWSEDGKILVDLLRDYEDESNRGYSQHITLWRRDGHRIGSHVGGSIGWSNDRNIAALGYKDSTIRFFDSTLQQIGTPSTGLKFPAENLKWNPGGMKLAAYNDQELSLWNLIPPPLQAEFKTLTIDQIMFLLRVYQYAKRNQTMNLNPARRQIYASLPTVIHDIIRPYVWGV